MRRLALARPWVMRKRSGACILACRSLVWLAVLLVVMLTVSPPAAAHAIVVASAPAAGSTVNGPNLDIRVQFNSRIDHERSKLVVMSDDGHAYPVELQEGEDDDMLVGHAQDVPAGTYRLRWVVLAIDGHITRGDIPFTVASP